MAEAGHAAALTAHRAVAPYDWDAVLALMQAAFAGMEGRIDPPSSIRDLAVADLAAGKGEVWVIGAPPRACVVLTPKPGALYVGKLAVAAAYRGQGLARQLIDAATARARDLGLPSLELQVRVELAENHAAFAAMGFIETTRTAHPGFARPTSITYRKPV
jgi:GNAT superfamily N-acetyltransferase